MSKLMQIINYLVGRVIYVWGANGEIVYFTEPNPEAWIKNKETSTTNANRVITLYRTKKAAGVFPLFAMDCSAFVCYILKLVGIINPTSDYNTKGLYAMCNTHPACKELMQGDLVFHTKDGTVQGIHHVGIYLGDGKVAECRGRDAGAVITEFDDHPSDWKDSWNMYGRLDALAPFIKDPHEDVEYPDAPISLAVSKPVSQGNGYRAMQEALNLLGYTDNDECMLAEDGKWGKRSRQAFDKCVEANRTPKAYTATVSGDDGTVLYEYKMYL